VSGALLVSAPASTANLGPGFDCAAAALDLWNELDVSARADGSPLVSIEGEGADELPHDRTHLALRAFALIAPLEGHSFRFRNRIPLERGLGSSAASVAAGLVAGCAVVGLELSPDRLLELGTPLEGHADNLAAALHGGVCLSWRTGERIASRQIATELPLRAIVVVPPERVNTSRSRARLPEFLRHEEAVAAASASAILGAAIASGDAELLAAAFQDRLHEPFRIADVPALQELRARPAAGSAGTTLSGSGPSVVVWAPASAADAVAVELEQRFPGARILPLGVAAHGAWAGRPPARESGDPLTTADAGIGAPA
jgi:homoserine kinase